MSTLHKKLQKTMTKPVHLLFRFYQSRSRIQIWLYQQPDLRIEGRIIVCPRRGHIASRDSTSS